MVESNQQESRGNLRIQVCYADPARQLLLDMVVAPGTNLLDAVRSSGILQQVPEIDLSVWRVGIFGKLRPLDTILKNDDRIEIYRPLKADPMESRRRRVNKRAAGS
jgi:putative ubiquitin-RnfH superfamily antitoxin RatB of RatAB toxin-antitoxin module